MSEMSFKKHSSISAARVARLRSDGTPVYGELQPRMYDMTTVSIYGGLAGVDPSSTEALSSFTIRIEEIVGSSPRIVEFNMKTRLDGEGNDYDVEPVWYPSSFQYDPSRDAWDLTISISSRVKTDSSLGFNAALVTVYGAGPISGSTWDECTVTYTADLPPSLAQGVPKKADPSAADPVFPSSASRVDIGVDTIPDYFRNSQGLERDYLFSDSSPLYVCEASGLMPAVLDSQSAFVDVSAYMRDTATGMKTPLPMTGPVKSGPVEILSYRYGPDLATVENSQMYVYKWTTELNTSAQPSPSVGEAVIEASLGAAT